MNTDELDFELPAELIAQAPAAGRAESRLLHYRRRDQTIVHRKFSDLAGILRRGDLLVMNDSRVIPARFMLRKNTGGKIEGLFIAQRAKGEWEVLLRNLGDAPAGMELQFDAAPQVTMRLARRIGPGEYYVAVDCLEEAEAFLERVGRMPLPPYIKRERGSDPRDLLDRERYQTVYAREAGSVAAPTAGFHFTPGVLAELDKAGIEHAFVTLHVGLGTFKPVAADTLEEHEMHSEAYSIGSATAEALNRAKAEGRRIVAVGTTAARVLESHGEGERWREMEGQTQIFIYPPYQWKHVGALVTNFHLPRSTLIALVATMVGLEEQRRIYRMAIGERYRFFSYGDAMIVE